MKWMGAWAVGVLLLAACGGSARTNVDLQSVEHASVSYTDGMTFSTRYTFAFSERVLLGTWSRRGPQGHRSKEESRSLSKEEAAQLQRLLEAIQLSEAHSGDCWTDTPTLTITFTDAEGTPRGYPTDPEKHRCNGAEVFAEEEDVQAFLNACRALLPEPAL